MPGLCADLALRLGPPNVRLERTRDACDAVEKVKLLLKVLAVRVIERGDQLLLDAFQRVFERVRLSEDPHPRGAPSPSRADVPIERAPVARPSRVRPCRTCVIWMSTCVLARMFQISW